MAAIRIDDARFPLVVIVFEGIADDREFAGYLAWMDQQLTRRVRCAFVLDATRAGRSPATQRRKQAEWMKANEPTLKKYSAGYAFVIDSALVRGALTAILWLQPMPAAHIVVATIQEAELWASNQLAQPAGRHSG